MVYFINLFSFTIYLQTDIMKTESLNTEESIKIISSMIQSTTYNIAEDKIIYLLWGYAVAISSLLQYSFTFIWSIENAWLAWLSMPVIGIYNAYYYSRKKKNKSVKTFTDNALGSIWSAFITALLVFLVAAPQTGWSVIYPVFMVLYGIGTSSTGGIIKFKPLVYGGYLSMLIGLIAFYAPYQYLFLLLALSIIVSYVIPGHMLPSPSKK